jgi:hypothetical protein
MKRFVSLLAILGVGLSLSACGHNMEQRAATGGIAGLLIAGPVGAAVGAGAGAVISKSQDGSSGGGKARKR